MFNVELQLVHVVIVRLIERQEKLIVRILMLALVIDHGHVVDETKILTELVK